MLQQSISTLVTAIQVSSVEGPALEGREIMSIGFQEHDEEPVVEALVGGEAGDIMFSEHSATRRCLAWTHLGIPFYSSILESNRPGGAILTLRDGSSDCLVN